MARPRKFKEVESTIVLEVESKDSTKNDSDKKSYLGKKEIMNTIHKQEFIEVVAIKRGEYRPDFKNLKNQGDRFTIKKEELDSIAHWVKVL